MTTNKKMELKGLRQVSSLLKHTNGDSLAAEKVSLLNSLKAYIEESREDKNPMYVASLFLILNQLRKKHLSTAYKWLEILITNGEYEISEDNKHTVDLRESWLRERLKINHIRSYEIFTPNQLGKSFREFFGDIERVHNDEGIMDISNLLSRTLGDNISNFDIGTLMTGLSYVKEKPEDCFSYKPNISNKDIVENYGTLTLQPFHQRFNISEKIGILVWDSKNKTLARHKPNGSIMIDRGTGSIIIHIYETEEYILFPYYHGSISSLYGFLFYSKKSKTLTSIGWVKTKKVFDTNSQKDVIKTFVETIQAYCKENSKIDKTSVTQKSNKALIFGQRNSYGHTIINDLMYLKNIYNGINGHDNIIAGNSDYIDTIALLTETKRDNILKKINPISHYKTNKKMYIFPQIFIYTQPSIRCDNDSLEIIQEYMKQKNKYKGIPENAGYFLMDKRRGRRSWRNINESFEQYCISLKQNNINILIIDGLTSIPNYEKSTCDTNIQIRDYTPASNEDDLFQVLSRIASDKHMNIEKVSGISFLRKLDIFIKYNIRIALCNYGSGMATPIYILNAPLILTGWDAIDAEIFEKWRWHHDKYCHRYRTTNPKLINSNKLTEKGYESNTTEIREKVSEELRKI